VAGLAVAGLAVAGLACASPGTKATPDSINSK